MENVSEKCGNGRFYARDVKVVQTHLMSETLKPSGIKMGHIKVDDVTENNIFLKIDWVLFSEWTIGMSKLGTK